MTVPVSGTVFLNHSAQGGAERSSFSHERRKVKNLNIADGIYQLHACFGYTEKGGAMFRILISLFGIFIRLMPLIVFCLALYRDSMHGRLKKAGYTEKDMIVDGVRFHYAESQDFHKPVLVLLHGHMLEWFSWRNVLIPLSEKYHVYAPDLPGHGKTVCPDDFEMNAENIGLHIARFIEEVTDQPVLIAGHSCGGLIALWLGAERPQTVRALILEDPPLFSSEYPAIRNTSAYRTARVCARAVKEDNEGDFLRFALRNDADLFPRVRRSFPGLLIMISRKLHYNATVEIPFVSPVLREMIRGMDQYDPHFGQAFYDGTWNENFNHADALCLIECPVLLLKGDSFTDSNGALHGAMSEENADFALSRLSRGSCVQISAASVLHTEAPEEYLKAVSLFLK